VGEWIPEPLPEPMEWIIGRPDGTRSDPADRVTLDESINMAFLVVLESMTPAERVAFILHDVFRYSFAEVAEIVGRTPIVPLLQIIPSKTDEERLLVVSPELADVLSTIIRRIREPDGTVPSVPVYDRYECVWRPPSPVLFSVDSPAKSGRSATAHFERC
jgi:hypothetical protein